MSRYIAFGATVAIIVALDQATKFMALTNLQLYESRELIAGFLNIVHVRNPGAVFGIFASQPPVAKMVFFVTVAALALAFILYYIIATKAADKLALFSLALVFAGALGNTIDRLRFGEVIDFIDCYLGSIHWPAFNIADSAISVGVVSLLIRLLRKK